MKDKALFYEAYKTFPDWYLESEDNLRSLLEFPNRMGLLNLRGSIARELKKTRKEHVGRIKGFKEMEVECKAVRVHLYGQYETEREASEAFEKNVLVLRDIRRMWNIVRKLQLTGRESFMETRLENQEL